MSLKEAARSPSSPVQVTGILQLQLLARHPARGLHQGRHRPHDVPPGEEPDEQPQQRRRDARRGQAAPAEGPRLGVEPRQRHAHVQHAQDLLPGGVGVAGGGGAGGRVQDGRDDAQHAVVAGLEDAAAIGQVEVAERLALGVAAPARLGAPVHQAPGLARGGREGDPPAPVHHADPLDAGLAGDVLHDGVGVRPPVLQHGPVERVADRVAEQVGLAHHLRQQVALDGQLGREEGGHRGERQQAGHGEEARGEALPPGDVQAELVDRGRRDGPRQPVQRQRLLREASLGAGAGLARSGRLRGGWVRRGHAVLRWRRPARCSYLVRPLRPSTLRFIAGGQAPSRNSAHHC
ncbi:MAG: hypothetical protein QM767_17745 [Anaeromyxobacter sp.]